MSDITIDDLVIKYEVPFWSQVKDSIMIDIEKYPRFGVTTIDSEIYNTDYYAPQASKVPWCDAFKKVVLDHQQFLAETLSDPSRASQCRLWRLLLWPCGSNSMRVTGVHTDGTPIRHHGTVLSSMSTYQRLLTRQRFTSMAGCTRWMLRKEKSSRSPLICIIGLHHSRPRR